MFNFFAGLASDVDASIVWLWSTLHAGLSVVLSVF